MAWASTRGNARNAHACALRTAPATQHREVGGGTSACHVTKNGMASRPLRLEVWRRPVRPGAWRPAHDVVPSWVTRSSHAVLGLPPAGPLSPALGPRKAPPPGPWRLPPTGIWKRRSQSRPLVMAELCAAYAIGPPDRHGAGAGSRAEASPRQEPPRNPRSGESPCILGPARQASTCGRLHNTPRLSRVSWLPAVLADRNPIPPSAYGRREAEGRSGMPGVRGWRTV